MASCLERLCAGSSGHAFCPDGVHRAARIPCDGARLEPVPVRCRDTPRSGAPEGHMMPAELVPMTWVGP
jgi:hypothetical protein